ncbi:MAG: histidine phosphatase family protein [Burkholderiaceae bacterium]
MARLRARHGKPWRPDSQETLAWRKREPDFAPPLGESLTDLRSRVVASVTELAARHPGEQILGGGAWGCSTSSTARPHGWTCRPHAPGN